MKYTVAVKKCLTYNISELTSAIENSLQLLGGLNKFIKKGEKVLLKPNLLTSQKSELACTTHPEFIRAVIKIVRKAGVEPYLGDSPGYHPIQRVLSVSGIKKVCEEENVPVVPFETPIEVKIPDGQFVKSLIIAKEVLNFDKIINLPKLKNHSLTQFTCATKNIYGVVPGLRKTQYHMRFPHAYLFLKMLIDLNRIIKPTLSIVDGVIGMEGEGPLGGIPKKVGVIMAGVNSIAVDYVAAKIINYDPDQLLLIKIAKESGFGGYSKDKIIVKGDKIDDLIVKDFKTLRPADLVGHGILFKIKRLIYKRILIKEPVVKRKMCQACQECIKICPAQTISLKNKKAKIKHNKCIHCYCCAEMCRYNAIKLTYFNI